MTLSLLIEISEPAWLVALPELEVLTERAVAAVVGDEAGTIEIGVTFADDDFVQGLNRQYRGKNKPTNVLSFPVGRIETLPPMGEGGAHPDRDGRVRVISLGDIVLAYQTIAREAEAENKTLTAHTQHLLIHGVLHLLGHDHETDDDAKSMETREIEILDAIGVANPYTVPSDA